MKRGGPTAFTEGRRSEGESRYMLSLIPRGAGEQKIVRNARAAPFASAAGQGRRRARPCPITGAAVQARYPPTLLMLSTAIVVPCWQIDTSGRVPWTWTRSPGPKSPVLPASV